MQVLRCGRRKRGSEWLAWDMSNAPPPSLDGTLDCVVHAAPLWVLPEHVARLADTGVARIVCFSSTSALTKRQSTSGAERVLAESLNRAEHRIREESSRFGVATTVLRPTMIYGYGRDANVCAIAGFIRRYGFFAVAGAGHGRRQPVHADDLVEAVIAVLDRDETGGRTYNLGGGEVLTYRTMVARIFTALRRPVRIIRVPTALYRSILAMAGIFNSNITPSMAARMNRDMVFDAADAQRDFGFAPQGFLERPDRDLPAR